MPKPERRRSHVGEWCAYRSPAMMHSHTAAYFIVLEEHPDLPMVRVTRPIDSDHSTREGCEHRRPRWLMEEYIRDYDQDEEKLRKRTRETLKGEANHHQESGGDAEIHETETAVTKNPPELPMHRVSEEGKGSSSHEG